MHFINIQETRINADHIAHYVQRRDGVLVTFVQGNDMMVVHAGVKEFDDAIAMKKPAKEWPLHPMGKTCPDCGARPGDNCRFENGSPRSEPHSVR